MAHIVLDGYGLSTVLTPVVGRIARRFNDFIWLWSLRRSIQPPPPSCNYQKSLVLRVAHIDGYSLFSFTRASAVVNCQSALACLLFR